MHTNFSRPLYVLLIAALLLAALGGVSTVEPAYASDTPQNAKAPLLSPGADVAISIHPLERVMIGENFDFYVTLDNSADTGYGPFIDLLFPANGADGAAGTDTPDGITFVSAEYAGYTLPATTLTFPDADGATGPGTTGCVAHPLAFNTTGAPAQVCGTAGDNLVVLELPFSSVTQAMPELWIKVTAQVSNLADVDTPLAILARGGYRYGADNLDNPASDPAILNPATNDGTGWPSLSVTPHVIYIEKTFDGPKECPYLKPDEPVLDETQCPYGNVNPVYESVSGPNYPRHYNLHIYIATGQTVTNLDVTDAFPNNIAFLSVISLGGGTLVDSPTVGVAANAPDNDLIVNFASLTGSTDINVEFFIPELDADGNPILDPATGNATIAQNTASAVGDWTPVDPRDAAVPDNALANSPVHELNIRSIAVQKSVAIATDNGASGYSPGDLLKYTLDFQISDYFTFGDLVLTDVMTDGQILDTTIAPAFTVSDWNNPVPLTGSFVTGNDLIITDPSAPTGNTTLAFNISTAMTNAGAADGILQGGEAGTTGALPATGQIIFYAKIQENFSYNYPSGDASVDHGDMLFNSVTLDATLRDENTITTILNTQTNDSAQKFEIVHDHISKEVYAVNGSTTFTPEVQPGDTITFRFKQPLPSSDSDRLTVTDYLPLPIFDAAEVNVFDDVISATAPSAGHVQFGPDNTFRNVLGVIPTISSVATANSLTFEFGSFDDPTDTSTVIDVLYTVTVSNAPYADGSILTNLTLSDERTTNNSDLYHVSGARFTLKEPGISLRKGVVASDNAAAVFVPNPPGPVIFNAPGSNPSWSGVIASIDNDPSTALINSDTSNLESEDLVTYAITLENLGHSSLGAFDISVKDSLPANMQIPAGGINLQVRRGDGAAVTYAPVGSTATDPSGLFDAGIVFTDESPTQGVAHVYDSANGQNLIVITYDLQIAANLAAGTTITNTATLLSYAGTAGGPNHVGATPTSNINSDDAVVTLPDIAPVITEGASVSVTMSENGSPIPYALTLHATDANNDPLTWSITSQGTHGTASATPGPANSSVTSYTPQSHYSGLDSFVVQVSDGTLNDSINVNVTIQPTSPSVTINQAASQADPANTSPVNFTATFSEPVTGFANGDVTLSGTAGATTATVTEIAPNDGTTFNVAVSGMTRAGTVVASIPAGVAVDTTNNSNLASTSTDNTVAYDAFAPTVTITQATGQTDPTTNSPIKFTAIFSEPIKPYTFTRSDVKLGGTAGATTVAVTKVNSKTFTITASGMTHSGTVIVSLPANRVTDLTGNLNTASINTDNTVKYTYLVLSDNLIINGGFNNYATPAYNIPLNWNAAHFENTDGKDAVVKYEGAASLKIQAQADVSKVLTQVPVKVAGAAGDEFKLSFWVKGWGVTSNAICEVRVSLYNGPALVSTNYIPCPSGTYEFQRKVLMFKAPSAYNMVAVRVSYKQGLGTAWLDALTLVRSYIIK